MEEVAQLKRTCVPEMTRLGVAPHVADKILNHQTGTISGVAAVYQKDDFLSELIEALGLRSACTDTIVRNALGGVPTPTKYLEVALQPAE